MEVTGWIAGAATFVTGVFGAVLKARTDRAVLSLLERISALEKAQEQERDQFEKSLRRQSRRLDRLQYRCETLEREKEELESELWQARVQQVRLDQTNIELREQNKVLRRDLQVVHMQVHDLRTIPPPILKG